MVRRAKEDRRTGAQVSRTGSIPAPIGGWDGQSALASMPSGNAVILDNFIPRPGYVELRKGSFLQASGIAQGAVKSLMVWRGSPADKLRACAGTSIYDVTTQGTLNPSALYSSATVATWEWINFANSGGTYVLAVNGTDTPIKDDGTAITTTAWTGTGPPVLDPTKLSTIMTHKRRVHMGEKNSLRVWFASAVDAISGACGLLDLGPVFTKGGVIVGMGTTSLDYGTGLDDFAVYVTNQGQIAMYQGTDPSDATKWSLVGVYNIGFPMGPRSLLKYGADMAVITTDGIIPLSQAIRLDRTQDNTVALTQLIQDPFHTATVNYPPGTFGWQGMLYPKGSLAIFNIPSSPAVQYVQNVQTGRWCRFTGMDASCWATANNAIYYGSGNTVLQFDVGADDNGTAITYDLKTAFTGFGSKGQKRFSAIRPLMNTVSWITPALEIDTDYRDTIPTATAIVVDVSDLVGVPRYDWSAASGLGFVAAVRMRIVNSNIPQTFLAIDSGDVDELVTGDGFSINTQDPLPVIPFALTSFDTVYEVGGIL